MKVFSGKINVTTVDLALLFLRLVSGGAIIGLFTRFAALVLVINFSVILFVVHKASEFSGKELSLLYLVIFFALMMTGAGKYSLDKRVFK